MDVDEEHGVSSESGSCVSDLPEDDSELLDEPDLVEPATSKRTRKVMMATYCISWAKLDLI
ncbi:hypothetical protein RvY_15219 [Ramazzottius varieornatus]|uniref:Uncharacterized protein n=1 Tax=Ramazzottius varieornatus TaxID=947166 RepID=A0A1D1VVG3_RAMVA|nr:hypothetical protein RvY_15219 [Ramazzottius varieornatus]